MSVTVHHGDCLDVLRGMAEASVDSVVTDPPAGISFMGREWDHHKGGRAAWVAWMRDVAAECLRVAKPGAHALVWSLPRTSHWTATAWEDAGWDVRDRVSHLFGTGFPKSRNIGKDIDRAAGAEREVVGEVVYADGHIQRSNGTDLGRMNDDGWHGGAGRVATAPATDAAKQWQGWGTALKPAVEDWWLLRKPLACPTVAAQVLATGTGALNIDATRVNPGEPVPGGGNGKANHGGRFGGEGGTNGERPKVEPHTAGRWPANLVTDGSPEVLEAFAAFGEKGGGGQSRVEGRTYARGDGWRATYDGPQYKDLGTAARFFPALGFGEDELRFHYSAKANKRDRAGSKHPTVKPQALLKWLCRLVTPPGGTILDPFAGSGSLATAALDEGFSAVLIEREAEYVADIERRLARPRPEQTDLALGDAA